MKDVTLVNVCLSNAPQIPAGILSVAATLERAGLAVEFRDYHIQSRSDLAPSSFARFLEGASRVYGIGCMSDALPFVVSALEELRRARPDAAIVLGGPGPTGAARGIIEHFPWIDAVVIGEGEETMRELAERLCGGGEADLDGVAGICWRVDGAPRLTSRRERIRDLDSLPMPLYERLAMERYPVVNIVCSRGCPYRCSFCDVAPMWGREHRRRSVESVVGEMRYLGDRYGKTEFEFTDETFVLKRADVVELCRRLDSDRLGARWACTGRVNLMTDDLLDAMAASGCRAVFYGIESGSDAVLARIRKEFSVSDAVDVLRRTALRARTVASFIWGFPFETREDLAATMLLVAYASRLGIDARLSRLAPLPLAPLTEEHRGRLVRIVDRFAFSAADPFLAGGGTPAIEALIARFPDVFSHHQWFPSDDLRERIACVERFGTHWLAEPWPIPCGGSRTGAGGGEAHRVD